MCLCYFLQAYAALYSQMFDFRQLFLMYLLMKNVSSILLWFQGVLGALIGQFINIWPRFIFIYMYISCRHYCLVLNPLLEICNCTKIVNIF